MRFGRSRVLNLTMASSRSVWDLPLGVAEPGFGEIVQLNGLDSMSLGVLINSGCTFVFDPCAFCHSPPSRSYTI
jgi:hypothetical protein